MKPSFVVAVSGVPGAGKSTLIQIVGKALGGASTLHFDDYGGSSVFPEDFSTWLASGGDPNEWKTPDMVRDLQTLRSGLSTSHPRSGITIEPTPIVILEEPFGRARSEIIAYVDFAAHLRVPLDVVLIRLVRRMLVEDTLCAEAERQGCPQVVESLFQLYLEDGWRELMQYTEKLAADSADIILDGMQAAEELASQLSDAIRLRYGDEV